MINFPGLVLLHDRIILLLEPLDIPILRRATLRLLGNVRPPRGHFVSNGSVLGMQSVSSWHFGHLGPRLCWCLFGRCQDVQIRRIGKDFRFSLLLLCSVLGRYQIGLFPHMDHLQHQCRGRTVYSVLSCISRLQSVAVGAAGAESLLVLLHRQGGLFASAQSRWKDWEGSQEWVK